MIGGETCDTSTRTCKNLPKCSKAGGSCTGNTSTNCIWDPAQDGGEGAFVQTTQTCASSAPCTTYFDDLNVQYSVCKESHFFENMVVDGVKGHTVSTLGTCLGTKTLSRMYRTVANYMTARSIECQTACVTNSSGFAYCK